MHYKQPEWMITMIKNIYLNKEVNLRVDY